MSLLQLDGIDARLPLVRGDDECHRGVRCADQLLHCLPDGRLCGDSARTGVSNLYGVAHPTILPQVVTPVKPAL